MATFSPNNAPQPQAQPQAQPQDFSGGAPFTPEEAGSFLSGASALGKKLTAAGINLPQIPTEIVQSLKNGEGKAANYMMRWLGTAMQLPGAWSKAQSAASQARSAAQQVADKTGKPFDVAITPDELQPVGSKAQPLGNQNAQNSQTTSSPVVQKTKTSQLDPFMQLQNGESTAHYMARIANWRNGMSPADATAAADKSNPAQQQKSTDTSGILDPSTQSNIASSMSSSPPTDLNSGGSALSSFMDAMGGGSSSGMMNILENQLQEIQSAVSTPPPSLVDTYNNLLNSSGIQADQAQLMNLDTMMNGTPQEIRNEIASAGGFASDSQIQALSAQRNYWLNIQAQNLQNGIAIKQQYVNEYVNLTGQDIQNAQAQWQKKFSLEDQLLNVMGRMQATDLTNYYRFQTSQMAKLKFAVDSGALANASTDTLATYSMTTGIDMNTLQQASTNAASKTQLSLLLQQSLLNERSGGGTPTTMADKIRNQKTTDYLSSVADSNGQTSATDYTSALQQFNGSGGTAANFINQFPPSQYLSRQQIDALPSDVPVFRTVKFQADLGDFVSAVHAGQVDSATAINTLLQAYPDQSTKINDAFKNLQ